MYFKCPDSALIEELISRYGHRIDLLLVISMVSCACIVPLALIEPTTCNLVVGADVPIPTAPSSLMNNDELTL